MQSRRFIYQTIWHWVIKTGVTLMSHCVSTQSCPVKMYLLLKKRNTPKGDARSLRMVPQFLTERIKSAAVTVGNWVTGKYGKLEKAKGEKMWAGTSEEWNVRNVRKMEKCEKSSCEMIMCMWERYLCRCETAGPRSQCKPPVKKKKNTKTEIWNIGPHT